MVGVQEMLKTSRDGPVQSCSLYMELGMHKVKVMFFATLRDYVGAKSVELEIPLQTTILGLTDMLVARYPRLEKVRDSMMAAINHEFAGIDQVIPEEAEIAFFPPVSGG
jgi:molybdopterin converting factor subunit 1